jgi:predicted Zn-dependent peptidase
MARLAGFTLYDDRYRPLDDMLAEIDRITPEQVTEVAREFFAPERQTVLRLGPEKT